MKIVKKQHRLTIIDLSELGYKVGDFLPLGTNEHVSSIIEMRDKDTKKQAGFSYLQLVDETDGVVLPQPFNFYLGKEKFDLSEYQRK